MFLTNDVRDASEIFRRHPTADVLGQRGRQGGTRGLPVRTSAHSPTTRGVAGTSDVNHTGNRPCRRLWMEMEHRHGRRSATRNPHVT